MTLIDVGRGRDGSALALRVLLSSALIAMSAGMVGLSFTTAASAAGRPADAGPPDKVTICHATGAHDNPYTVQQPDKSSDVGGHDGHVGPIWFPGITVTWGDIIPEFTYKDSTGATKTYPGRNHDLLGQETLANKCNYVTPDLRLTKTSSGPAVVGTTGSYTIAVKNIGTRTAAGPFSVSDTLPSGVVATSASGGPDWSCTVAGGGGSVSCTHAGSLAPGGAAADITLAVTWVTEGPKTNSATVSTVAHETQTANNTGSVMTQVRAAAPSPDLSLTKTSSTSAVAGSSGFYYVDVQNVGQVPAQGTFTVTDTMPAGVVAASASGMGWSCTLGASGASFSCDHAGNLLAQASADRITVSVNWVTSGPKTNTAQVSAVRGETVTANNRDDVETTVTAAPAPDLQLVKSGPAVATTGTSGSYTVDVSNVGGAVAQGAFSVTDTMPSGVMATAAGGSGWLCTVATSGASVSCAHAADLASGVSAGQITVSVNWEAVGEKTNVATVSTVSGETVTANNSDDAVTRVSDLAVVDLKLTKSGPASRLTGQTGNYMLLVENVGTGAATAQIVLTDTLPAGVSVADTTSDGFTCVSSSSVVTCTTEQDLPAGGSRTVVLPATFSAVGSKTNSATVSTSGDGNAANDRSKATTSVSAPPTCEERGDCPPPPTCEERGDCPPPPTCEERGNCPPPPTCEELGNCPPPPTCQELGNCPPPPTCEEQGNCPPPPTCQQLGNCPPPPNGVPIGDVTDPDPATGGDTDGDPAETPTDENTTPPATPPADDDDEEQPRALPFTGGSTDLLLGLGAGLSVMGLMLALTGRRRRLVE